MHRWCLLNLTVQGFSLNLTVRGVSNKHCLLTFSLVFFFEWPLKTGFTVQSAVNIQIFIQVSVCR